MNEQSPPTALPLSIWPVAQHNSGRQRTNRYTPESIAHPGKMLPAIARQAIDRYTQSGDIVVDPMCGIGTTLVESVHLGRNAFGVEYEKRWTNLANANVLLARSQGAQGSATAVHGDGQALSSLIDQDLVGRVSLVITSPPYGPSLHGQVVTSDQPLKHFDAHYSSDRSNLEYATTSALLEAFANILGECKRVLRPGGVVVVTTRPWRRNGALVDLPSEVFRLGRTAGLIPFERNVALLCALRGDQLVPRPSFFQLDYVRKARERGVPLSVISHEDVLVFTKGTSKYCEVPITQQTLPAAAPNTSSTVATQLESPTSEVPNE